MRVANGLKIDTAPGWNTNFEKPPRLVLVDDQGDEMDSIPLAELAKALAPFLTLQVVAKEEET